MTNKIDIKSELATIQKVVDLAQKQKTTLEIIDETGLTLAVVNGIKKLYGLKGTRRAVNILDGGIKKVSYFDGNAQININLNAIVTELDLDMTKEWGVTASSYNVKQKTITLVFKEL